MIIDIIRKAKQSTNVLLIYVYHNSIAIVVPCSEQCFTKYISLQCCQLPSMYIH